LLAVGLHRQTRPRSIIFGTPDDFSPGGLIEEKS